MVTGLVYYQEGETFPILAEPKEHRKQEGMRRKLPDGPISPGLRRPGKKERMLKAFWATSDPVSDKKSREG